MHTQTDSRGTWWRSLVPNAITAAIYMYCGFNIIQGTMKSAHRHVVLSLSIYVVHILRLTYL